MSNARATRPRLHYLAERVGVAAFLDGPAEAVAGWVRGAVPRGPVKDTLSGTPLGHALHPLLTDLPIGTWTSAALLDLVGGRAARPASRRLIAAGLLAAVPTAASGLNDWADTTPADDGVRRIGAVHAVANVAALGLRVASLAARRPAPPLRRRPRVRRHGGSYGWRTPRRTPLLRQGGRGRPDVVAVGPRGLDRGRRRRRPARGATARRRGRRATGRPRPRERADPRAC
jgi:predicted membrane protein DUF2231